MTQIFLFLTDAIVVGGNPITKDEPYVIIEKHLSGDHWVILLEKRSKGLQASQSGEKKDRTMIKASFLKGNEELYLLTANTKDPEEVCFV